MPTVYTWRSFSGTEKALAFCALQVALASGSKLRLAVLDEMGRMDRGNKAKVARLLIQLVADGKLDQAVLVDTERLESEMSDRWFSQVEVKP